MALIIVCIFNFVNLKYRLFASLFSSALSCVDLIFNLSSYECKYFFKAFWLMGPSIYGIHAEVVGIRLRWTLAGRGRGQLHVDVHTENYSQLSSFHAKKLAFSVHQNFVFERNKKWKFFINLN